MPVVTTQWGTGTVRVGNATGGTEVMFESECEGAVITHEYEDTADERTMLSGDTLPGSARRTDGFTAQIVNNLSQGGLYDFLQFHDLTEQPFEFVPNTADGHMWTGTVQVRLPADIGADEYGLPIVSEIAWTAVGKLTYVPFVPPPPGD